MNATAALNLWKERLETPAYKVGEAARYANVPPQTVAHWERTYADGTSVLRERKKREGLSFLQLIEVAVVAAMRNSGVKLKEIKEARKYFSKILDVQYPFAQARFKTDGVDIFLEHPIADKDTFRDKLLAANHNGQWVWSDMLQKRLNEFNYGSEGEVLTWAVNGTDSPILIDPRVCFGAPQVSGIPTKIIESRWKAGEDLEEIAEDFDLELGDVKEALKFEDAIPLAAE